MRTFFVVFAEENLDFYQRLVEKLSPPETLPHINKLLATEPIENLGLVSECSDSVMPTFLKRSPVTRFTVDLKHDDSDELETILVIVKEGQDPDKVVLFIASKIEATVLAVQRQDGLPNVGTNTLH